ncbi:MAG TPA: UPF0175 family protein [Herpetosiphonaceae bacterium]|nr:UPF0175 family protein [Herpetosiphonaceae bacterium]
MYTLGKIGSGRAAQMLGIPRRTFLLDVLGRYGLSHFDEQVDLAAEASRG